MDAADTPRAFADVAAKVRDWVSLWYTKPLGEIGPRYDDAWERLREAAAGEDYWEPGFSINFRGIPRRSAFLHTTAFEWWCNVGELRKQG